MAPAALGSMEKIMLDALVDNVLTKSLPLEREMAKLG